MKQNKRIISLLLCLLFAVTAATLWAGGAQEKETEKAAEPEKTSQEASALTAEGDAAAVVNGNTITREYLARELNMQLNQAMQQGIFPDEEQMKNIEAEVLDNLIKRQLLLELASDKGIEADEEALNDQMDQVRNQFPSEEEFNKALEAQNLTKEDLRAQYAMGMVINNYIVQHIQPEIKVSVEESQTFYEENPNYFKQPAQIRASHILLQTGQDASEDDKAAAKAKAEEVKAKLDQGADFATLAQEYSEGPSASRGGDLDYFSKGRMVPEFEEAAFALAVGEISGIVETQFGYHIIKVTDKKESGMAPFQEVGPQIEQHLAQVKMGEKVDSKVEALRETADIVIAEDLR